MADDERLRRVELWQAGAIVEIGHLKDAIEKTGIALEGHAKKDSEGRAELWRAQRRFMWGMLALILTALLGSHFAN